MSGKGTTGPPNGLVQFPVQFTIEALAGRMLSIIPKGDVDDMESVLGDVDEFLGTYEHYLLEKKAQGPINELGRELHVMKMKVRRAEAALRAQADQLIVHQKREDSCRCNEGEEEDDPSESNRKRRRSPSN